jgi:high-affinity iron transporter
MLLTAIIIILREVLEITLLMSLLASVSKHLNVKFYHFFISLLGGGIFAYIYAENLSVISELFEYTGQEWVNSILQITIYLSLGFFIILLRINKTQMENIKGWMMLLMLLPIILAVTREGSEIYIYIGSFFHSTHSIFPIAVGSIIGSCIGLSIGALIYYSLTSLPLKLRLVVVKLALAVTACGVLSQAVALLLQADVLHSYPMMWDSSKYLAEDSVVGQLLYAIVGYEATPAPQQVIVYVAGLLFIGLGAAAHQYYGYRKNVDV